MLNSLFDTSMSLSFSAKFMDECRMENEANGCFISWNECIDLHLFLCDTYAYFRINSEVEQVFLLILSEIDLQKRAILEAESCVSKRIAAAFHGFYTEGLFSLVYSSK